MTSAWFPRLITLGLLAMGIARAALVWDRLPEPMASHFGAGGVPNAWSSRGRFFLVLGVAGGGVTLLLANIGSLLRWLPRSIVNLPHREYWSTDERWPIALAKTTVWMAWFGVATAALLLWVVELTLRANLAAGPLPAAPMWGSLALYLGFAVSWLVGLQRAFRPPPSA